MNARGYIGREQMEKFRTLNSTDKYLKGAQKLFLKGKGKMSQSNQIFFDQYLNHSNFSFWPILLLWLMSLCVHGHLFVAQLFSFPNTESVYETVYPWLKLQSNLAIANNTEIHLFSHNLPKSWRQYFFSTKTITLPPLLLCTWNRKIPEIFGEKKRS